MAKKTSKNKSLDLAYMGMEPTLKTLDTMKFSGKVQRIWNWYHYVHSTEQSRAWLVISMKEKKFSTDDIRLIKNADDWEVPSSLGWLARMQQQGTVFSQEVETWLLDKINATILKLKEAKAKEVAGFSAIPKAVVNIQDRTKAKNNSVMDTFEELHDSYFEPGEHKSMYDFLIENEVTASAANFIKDKITPAFEEVFSGDEQIKEAFGKKLKYWQTTYQSWIDDLDRFLNNKKVVKIRKPRTVKVKPVTKIIENIKFQKEDTTLKIVSVNPAELVGAKSVWLYNTKYRDLSVFHAQNNDGITVKGTTLINYDEATAMNKKLRKPEETIAALFGAGKVALRKIMDEIKTAPGKPNGRINNNTIILKVLK